MKKVPFAPKPSKHVMSNLLHEYPSVSKYVDYLEDFLTSKPDASKQPPSPTNACICPECQAAEIDAMTPRTVYACGSSDYDGRPGSFKQSEKCQEILCIRAAKRVIAAINLPEGAGVAWDDVAEIWEVYEHEPRPFEGPMPNWRGWHWYGTKFRLPPTAIPPWPGDFWESWITASTQEVK